MSTVPNPICWQNYDIKKNDLLRLLKNANCDTDPASIVYFGTSVDAAEFAVIVVKGREQVKVAALALENLKLYTPGKPINPGAHMRDCEPSED